MLELIVAVMIVTAYKIGKFIGRFEQKQDTKEAEETKPAVPYIEIYVEGDDKNLYAYYAVDNSFLAQAPGYQALLDRIAEVRGSCILDVKLVDRNWKEERP